MQSDRNSISSDSLKKVIIRYDFIGATYIDNWISEIKAKYCRNKFREYTIGEQGNATIDMSNLEEISERLSIPLSEINRQPIHIFSGSTFDGLQDIVQLEITNYSITLSIECRNYVSIEPYLDFINKLAISFLETDLFIRIQRIGIRKLDGFQYSTWEEMEKYLKGDAIGILSDLLKDTALFREYSDSWYWKKYNSKINFIRKIRNVTLVTQKPVYQIVLDMDAYSDEEVINTPENIDIQFLLKETFRLNDALFELFSNSITDLYVKEHAKG